MTARLRALLPVSPALAVVAGLATGVVGMGPGCGGDEAGAPEVEGIYQVTAHTLDTEACAAEGATVTDRDGYFLMRRYSLLGFPYYQATGCASLADCRAKASDPMPMGPFSFTFDQAKGGGRLEGQVRFTGFSRGAQCEEPELSRLSFVRTEMHVRIEKRTQVGAPYPAEDGFCTTEAGARAAAKEPCSRQEVMTATFVERLP